MNQEKIGLFISKMRKEKGLTQAALAEKLGITDRAISKWENGRGMPEISLMIPLCEELDISLNELLSGERIEKELIEKKSEENIISTLEISAKKIKSSKRLLTIASAVIAALFIIFSALFLIDQNRMDNNKPVVFSTWEYKYAPSYDFPEEDLTDTVNEYFNYRAEEQSSSKVKYFTESKVYLTEEIKHKELYCIYTLTMLYAYDAENGKPIEGSEKIFPSRFYIENTGGRYAVTDCEKPSEEEMTSLKNNIESKAEKYFRQ